jgi:hypothetical protein
MKHFKYPWAFNNNVVEIAPLCTVEKDKEWLLPPTEVFKVSHCGALSI